MRGCLTAVLRGIFFKRLVALLFVFFMAGILVLPAEATHHEREHPKRANYFLKWSLTESEARELAKWDLLVLDMEVQLQAPELLKKMREWNPDIVLLAYITPQEIRSDAAQSYSRMRRALASGIAPEWYLQTSGARQLSWWPGTILLNITNDASRVNGQRYNEYLAAFVAKEIMGSGLWDGIFYDNAWDNITYFAKTTDIDLDGNRTIDGNLDHAWREGMKTIYQETRRLAGRPIIMVGNGLTQVYKNELDGNMLENFHDFSWNEIMNAYQRASRGLHRINIVNANTGNGGDRTNYQRMRYGMTSALMENGYYSFDYGDTKHEQTWWYDEYQTDLGIPSGSAVSQKELRSYQSDIWRRDFAKGIAIVNSTPQLATIQLGGDFEALHGTQDTAVNNGRIVSEVEVAGNDGQILLKTFEQLKDIVFTNGNFVRFLRKNGSRVRNGLFVFDPVYQGGDMILRKDVNQDGEHDTMVISDNKLTVTRSDGQLFFSLFPYTADYHGTMHLAVGDIDGDKQTDIIIAPSEGTALPIKIYDLFGDQIRDDWYPFGKKYRGGYSITIADLDEQRTGRIVIGSGTGVEPTVSVYKTELGKELSFRVFEKKFRGGVKVAVGDVTNDGISEIVVAPRAKKKPVVRVFNIKGTEIQKEFTAFTTFGAAEVELLQLSDVDFDGVNDILVFTKNVGL